MRLPTENPNSKEVQSRVKDFVNKSRTQEGRTDTVYVLECNKPKSKQSAIETAEELLEEYSTNDEVNNEVMCRDPTKRIRNNTSTKPSSFKEALDTETNNTQDNAYISYPYWIEYCYKANHIFYVGWSNRVDKRITDHITSNGALFTKIFSPIKIEEIRWYPSKSAAKEAERKVAREYLDIGNSQDEYKSIKKFRQNKSELGAELHEDEIRKYAYYA